MPPHPLAGASQQKIVQRLKDPRVSRVLDAGSHAATEADVTLPMATECLGQLREVDDILRTELGRLDGLRRKEQQGKILEGTDAVPQPDDPAVVQMPGQQEAFWDRPLAYQLVGRAAAQTHGCVVALSDLPEDAEIAASRLVLAASDVMAPVVRAGQWLLLGPDDDEPGDHDLVAAIDRDRNCYLRRGWIDGEHWMLEGVNPLSPVAPVRLAVADLCVRKVVGVLYEPARQTGKGTKRTAEWSHRNDYPVQPFLGLQGIQVDGSSLEPIALGGQTVLVGPPLSNFADVEPGALAVVETEDDDVGDVVKLVYPLRNNLIALTSPNSIDPRQPIVLPLEALRAIRPVRGVLFMGSVVEPSQEPS